MHRGKSAALALAATAALLGTAGLAQADGSAPAPSPSATPSAGDQDTGGKDSKDGKDGKDGNDGHGKRAKGKRGKVTGDGAEALCKRAPKIDKRLARALKRLRGPETRRGSIARVKKRIEYAKKEGHTEIATFLNDRLKFRNSLLPTLEKRQKDLAKVKEWCTAHSNGSTT
ncbi:hypothetical protein [Streptomyces coffeae]|uniref:Uncharacterized protein n=1 Tax=Streptomyces coffeae TaxID=621382 RepID=A0ABS1N872_9ACTN|nr:hypothetical protein [Streptomyces coffeae]MBL1096119.1 hypothetical protein [Streptomyces coffeae]